MGSRLQNKVAVVTGAGRGIGRGIALLMAAEGAAVVVNDLGVNVDGRGQDTSAADETVATITAAGGRAVANHESVADFAAAERIIDTAVQRFGRIDILVNNAGILRDRMIFNMSEEDFDSVVAVHLKGTFNCSRHAAVRMREQKSGRIISMSSTSGLYGNTGQANYGAAKDGIAGFTRVVSRDLGRYGITVNAIAPAAATRMTATVGDAARRRARARESPAWAPRPALCCRVRSAIPMTSRRLPPISPATRRRTSTARSSSSWAASSHW
jgi:NAD(P)-dependent dehydrogenase (short-subunit alcohol dehydrogenase family)